MTCAFGPCTCPIWGTDEHCGPTCRLGIGEVAEPCKCGHAECSATVGSAPAVPLASNADTITW
jgi:hypothetical protein